MSRYLLAVLLLHLTGCAGETTVLGDEPPTDADVDDDDTNSDDDDVTADDDDSGDDDDGTPPGDDDTTGAPDDCMDGGGASPEAAVEVPGLDAWLAVEASVGMVTGKWFADIEHVIDVQVCAPEGVRSWLPYGEAFAFVWPEDGQCTVWLGGEMEDPDYDGLPTSFCRFPAFCQPVTAVVESWLGEEGEGGPAWIDSPFCVNGSPGGSR